jgi:hypothetical protein
MITTSFEAHPRQQAAGSDSAMTGAGEFHGQLDVFERRQEWEQVAAPQDHTDSFCP